MRLPFSHINLKYNPFGELPLDERPLVAVVDVDEAISVLMRQRSAVQFIGDKGYGKTTHLLVIRSRLPGSTYVHIPEGETRRLRLGHPTIVDEAQRLTRWQQIRLFRQRGPLLLGTHRDFTPELERAGRQVHTIAVETTMSLDRLDTLLSARISRARRSAGPVPQIRRETSRELLARFGPNVRAIEHWLYEQFQSLQEIKHV